MMSIVERNRANAQKSTGPRTARGRARSSMNAVTFGATANSLVLPGESSRKANAMVRSIERGLGISGPLGRALAADLVLAGRKEERIRRFEEAAVRRALKDAESFARFAETAIIDRLRESLTGVDQILTMLESLAEMARNATGTVPLADYGTLVEMVANLIRTSAKDLCSAEPWQTDIDVLQRQVHDSVGNLPDPAWLPQVVAILRGFRETLAMKHRALIAERAERIALERELASIPDEKSLKRISRYRAMNEQSLLRKLRAAREIKALLAAEESAGFDLHRGPRDGTGRALPDGVDR